MTRAPKPVYNNQPYGTTGDLNKRMLDIDAKEITGRNNNIPPASINTTDNTRTVEAPENEVAQITGQQGVTASPMLGQPTSMLDILRDTEFANENVTTGANGTFLSETQLGDMDYEVLANLSGNTSVNALKEILGA